MQQGKGIYIRKCGTIAAGEGDLYPPRMWYQCIEHSSGNVIWSYTCRNSGIMIEISVQSAAGASGVEDDREEDELLSDADDASSSSQSFSKWQGSKSVQSKHRVKGHDARWTRRFLWIRFTDKSGGMFCNICCEVNTDNTPV